MPYKFTLSFFLLMGTVLTGLRAQLHPGDRPVTYEGKNVKLSDFFMSVWQQTMLRAFYNDEQLSSESIITVKFEREPLDNVLASLLRKRGLTWYYREETFVILPIKPGQPILGELPEEATINVTGRVTNKSGVPLEHASVLVKGSRKGAYTNETGTFTITKVKKRTALLVSCIGYSPKEIQVKKGKDTLSVQLAEATTGLDEVMVIAYGTSTRRNLTGSVSRVSAADIAKQPVADPLLAMQGRVPGLNITQLTGLSGGDVKVELRGRNSIAAGNNPLYIVDGMPFPGTALTLNNVLKNGRISPLGASNSLNMVNIADIESIEVLKDADATAIYGSRGANGVILITTKKGKPGNLGMEANLYTGIGKMAHGVQYMNTQQYLQMRREAFVNDKTDPHAYDYDLTTWDTTRYTDWQKVMLGGTANITDGQVAFSGGNTTMQVRVSGGYRRETTAYPGSFNYQKAAGRINLALSTPDQRGKVAVAVGYVADRNYLPRADMAAFVTWSPNTPPAYNADGTLNWENSTFDNPMAALLKTYKASTNNLMANVVLSYKVLENAQHSLELKTSLGYNSMFMDEKQPNPKRSFDPVYNYVTGYSFFANGSVKSWIVEPQASYRRKLGKGQLDVLVGTTFQQDLRNQEGFLAYGFTSDAMLENKTAAGTIGPYGNTYYQYRYNALFGRVNYNWEGKYIVNLTGRRDGSSRFGPGRQFANFGAIGAAWIFSREPWLQNVLPFLSFGKLRGSYGSTGNDQIADYGYNATYTATSQYQGWSGLSPTRLFNPNYSWELSKKLEAGLELGFMQDQVLFRASYYRNRSSNQLVNYSLSGLSGFNSILNNFPALVENTGIELELNTVNMKRDHFSWSTAFNISIPNNKLLAFPGLENTPYNNYYTVGQPLNILKGFHYTGVNPQTGVYEFTDVNKDGKISYYQDYTFTKKTGAVFYGGLQNSLQYKGWQLDVLFQFVKQNRYNYLYANFIPGINANQPVAVLGRWQGTGNSADIQRFTQAFDSVAQAYYNIKNSDAAVANASFIRLKNLSLGYQLPAKWMKSAHLQSARFYLQGQNLFTITPYKGRDPEVATDSDVYPPLRIWTVGLQLGL